MRVMDQLEHRTGETGLLPFRTRRVFNVGSEWFFAIRGEKDQGPFENQQDAMNGLDQFLNEVKLKKSVILN